MDRDTTRRSVLRAVSTATLFGATATTVQAATSDELADLRAESQCTCEIEYRCTPYSCPYSGQKLRNMQQYRECCTCDSGTVCDDWAVYSRCCHYFG